MNIQCEGNTYPIEVEDIDMFECRYNIKLPADYREFLMEHNGGKPEIRRFRIRTGKIKSSFMFIMPLIKEITKGEVKHNLEYCYIRYIVRQKMPDKYLPFGETPREDILCISVKGDDYGSVYLWGRENEWLYNVPAAECYHLIAESFTEFLNELRENDKQFI